MFRQAPAGQKHIRVCRTLSCAMAGSYQLMDESLRGRRGIDRASRRERNAQSGVGERRMEITASSLSNVSPVAGPRRSAWSMMTLHENVAAQNRAAIFSQITRSAVAQSALRLIRSSAG